MKPESLFAGIADAFARPFAKGNIKRLLLGLLFLLLPLTFIIADGDAYAMAAGRKGTLNDRSKLGLKILLVRLLYGAPALLIYGGMMLLNAYYESIPLLLSVALCFLLSIFVMRFLILSPLAACYLALDAPLKLAANGGEMKRVLSGSLGRYLLYALVMYVPLLIPALYINDLPYIWQFFAIAPFALLYTYIGAGLYMSCVRHSLGLPTPPRGEAYPAGTARRAAAFGMALVLLLSGTSLHAQAVGDTDTNANPTPVPGVETSDPVLYTTYRECYEYYAQRGMIGPNREIAMDGRTHEWYLRDTAMDNELRTAGNFVIFAADLALDEVPVLGNIKNGLQLNYYIHQALNAETAEERQAAWVAAGYSAAGLALGGLGKAVGAAKGASGQKLLKKYLSASKVEKANKALEYAEKGLNGIDKIKGYYDTGTNFVTGVDFFTGREDSEAIGPNGLVTVGKYFVEKAVEDALTPAQGPRTPIIYIYKDTSGMPSEYEIPVSDTTIQLEHPSEVETGIPIIQGTAEVSPVGTYECQMTGFYTGAGTVEGVTYNMTNYPVYITINEARQAGFDTMTEFTVVTKISGAGTGMSSKSSTRLTKASITGQYNEIADTYLYTFTEVKNVNVETNYAGLGYTNGGGSITTVSPSEFEVTFTLSADPVGLTDTFVWFRIQGEIVIRPEGWSGGTAQQNSVSRITFEGSRMIPITYR